MACFFRRCCTLIRVTGEPIFLEPSPNAHDDCVSTPIVEALDGNNTEENLPISPGLCSQASWRGQAARIGQSVVGLKEITNACNC